MWVIGRLLAVGDVASVAACGSTTAAVIAPTPAPAASAAVPIDTAAHQSQRGSLKSGGVVRVAGGVKRYGDARCTQRFQLGNEPKPGRKKTLLLCWRTSAQRSVIVVVVALKNAPSKARAVGELDAKWRSLA
jgi:hypothetical protein